MRVIETISERIDNVFRVSDEYAGTYQKLSGAWFAVGGFCVEQVIDQLDHGIDSGDVKNFAAYVALSATTLGTGAFFHNRARQSVGEYAD